MFASKEGSKGSNLFWFNSPTAKALKGHIPLEGAAIHAVRPTFTKLVLSAASVDLQVTAGLAEELSQGQAAQQQAVQLGEEEQAAPSDMDSEGCSGYKDGDQNEGEEGGCEVREDTMWDNEQELHQAQPGGYGSPHHDRAAVGKSPLRQRCEQLITGLRDLLAAPKEARGHWSPRSGHSPGQESDPSHWGLHDPSYAGEGGMSPGNSPHQVRAAMDEKVGGTLVHGIPEQPKANRPALHSALIAARQQQQREATGEGTSVDGCDSRSLVAESEGCRSRSDTLQLVQQQVAQALVLLQSHAERHAHKHSPPAAATGGIPAAASDETAGAISVESADGAVAGEVETADVPGWFKSVVDEMRSSVAFIEQMLVGMQQQQHPSRLPEQDSRHGQATWLLSLPAWASSCSS
ncbi:hypothetical protein HaLaN_26978, partial [Haematococcus lacustris]